MLSQVKFNVFFLIARERNHFSSFSGFPFGFLEFIQSSPWSPSAPQNAWPILDAGQILVEWDAWKSRRCGWSWQRPSPWLPRLGAPACWAWAPESPSAAELHLPQARIHHVPISIPVSSHLLPEGLDDCISRHVTICSQPLPTPPPSPLLSHLSKALFWSHYISVLTSFLVLHHLQERASWSYSFPSKALHNPSSFPSLVSSQITTLVPHTQSLLHVPHTPAKGKAQWRLRTPCTFLSFCLAHAVSRAQTVSACLAQVIDFY